MLSKQSEAAMRALSYLFIFALFTAVWFGSTLAMAAGGNIYLMSRTTSRCDCGLRLGNCLAGSEE
jgi:hypothetical protein